jgi:hypothetical protein
MRHVPDPGRCLGRRGKMRVYKSMLHVSILVVCADVEVCDIPHTIVLIA